MITDVINQLSTSVTLLQHNLPFMLSLIAGLWCIHFINWILGGRLIVLGVYPRKWFSCLGIFFLSVYPRKFQSYIF